MLLDAPPPKRERREAGPGAAENARQPAENAAAVTAVDTLHKRRRITVKQQPIAAYGGRVGEEDGEDRGTDGSCDARAGDAASIPVDICGRSAEILTAGDAAHDNGDGRGREAARLRRPRADWALADTTGSGQRVKRRCLGTPPSPGPDGLTDSHDMGDLCYHATAIG